MFGGEIVAFVFGLIFGSFLNVVIVRYDEWLSIVKDRSHCPHCKQKLSWLDLIPLLSYLSLGGRCRYCQKPISWQYPVVEITTAVLMAAGYSLIFTFNDFELFRAIVVFAAYVVVVGALVTTFFHDLYEMLIPDSLAYILLIAAAVFSLFYFQNWQTTIIGGLAGVLPIALLVYPSKGVWMGEGDVKIAAALGLLVGWPSALVFLITAFVSGGIFGALLLIIKVVKLKTAVPFAPFLIIGGLVALFWGPLLVEWYLGVIGYGYY